MALVPASVAKQAEILKADGNTYFKKERLGAAIDAYTEAIALCPNVAVYWTNRALCFRKRNEWTRVEEDCRKALQLDHNSVKAHYMLGLALLEQQDHAGGIKELEKAFDLERSAKPPGHLVEEVWQTLAEAKYNEWERESSERSWKLQKLEEACEKALLEQRFLDVTEDIDEIKEAVTEHSKDIEHLKEVFSKAAEVDIPTEVPDYLCCKITLDIFRDPVITPSGITYERAVLLDHLRQVVQIWLQVLGRSKFHHPISLAPKTTSSLEAASQLPFANGCNLLLSCIYEGAYHNIATGLSNLVQWIGRCPSLFRFTVLLAFQKQYQTLPCYIVFSMSVALEDGLLLVQFRVVVWLLIVAHRCGD